MGLKILHSADWHLDSPFSGFDPERRSFLKDAQKQIPGKVADICRREDCDLVLLSGDLFDGPASRDSIENLKNALEEMAVPVFISPGNHDFVAPGSPWLEEKWPENVHIFKGAMESVTVPELSCRVYGAGYTSMDCPGLLENFRAEGDERYCVAVLHGDPVQLHSPYCPVTAAQVRESGLQYLALGHIHKYGAFRGGSTVCGWPGSPMGRGWDETGEKGVYLVQLEETASLRLLPLNLPRFFEWTVDSGEGTLEDKLPAGGSRDFYRITLTGNGTGDPELLREKFPNLIVKDRRQRRDLWESAGTDTLEGLYFQLLRQATEDADPETARRARLAAEISRNLLDGREVALP